MIARGLLLVACLLCVSTTMYTQEQKGEQAQAPVQQTQSPQRVRLSQDAFRGLVITRVQPDYPVKERADRVQGDVVLRAVFSTTGDFKALQVISGDSRLVLPSIKALRRWKCKPYEVNGVPVEVETDITFKFWLR
jgi:periplasmic protein TonB